MRWRSAGDSDSLCYRTLKQRSAMAAQTNWHISVITDRSRWTSSWASVSRCVTGSCWISIVTSLSVACSSSTPVQRTTNHVIYHSATHLRTLPVGYSNDKLESVIFDNIENYTLWCRPQIWYNHIRS